jgi:HSP20 family protein
MLPVIRKRMYLPDLSDHFFGRDFMSNFLSDGADYSVPSVNIREGKKAFEIELAVPGMDKNDLNIQLDKDVLTISAEKKNENTDGDNDRFMRREFSYSTFKRSFTIPDTVNVEKIKASHENGVLKVELPKMEEDKSKLKKMIKIS